MTKRLRLIISAITVAATILCGCTSFSGSKEESDSYERVIALSKSVSEMWLLAGGSLVGTTEDALDLDDMTEGVQSIGTVSKPNTETVVALKPDVVMMTLDLPSHKKFKEELEGLGIRVLTVDIGSFQDYDDAMRNFTSVTGRDDLYNKNVLEVKERIDAILEEYNAGQRSYKTYLFLRVSATKNKAMKKDYFGCEIIDSFGLTNIAYDNSSLDELSLEAITAADPDYIFIIYQGKEKEAMSVLKEEFTSKEVWRKLSAVADDQVYMLPKDLFQYKPNARWDEAYRYIYENLR
nr:ABC transporter substrate-binding protein [uncultured Butyrivibrio sp.]